MAFNAVTNRLPAQTGAATRSTVLQTGFKWSQGDTVFENTAPTTIRSRSNRDQNKAVRPDHRREDMRSGVSSSCPALKPHDTAPMATLTLGRCTMSLPCLSMVTRPGKSTVHMTQCVRCRVEFKRWGHHRHTMPTYAHPLPYAAPQLGTTGRSLAHVAAAHRTIPSQCGPPPKGYTINTAAGQGGAFIAPARSSAQPPPPQQQQQPLPPGLPSSCYVT